MLRDALKGEQQGPASPGKTAFCHPFAYNRRLLQPHHNLAWLERERTVSAVGRERGGEGFAGLLFFFSPLLIPSPTPSPHSFYFHVNFSTPFSPRHSEKSLRSPQQDSSFFFRFNFYSKTPHIYLYRELQPYTVLTLFSVSVLDFFFNCNDAQFTSVSMPASLRLQTLTRQNLRDAGESARRRSRAIDCLVCLLLGT